MADPRFLTAAEAASELGVSLATLYAYVSRGLLRSEEIRGDQRRRRYVAEDVRLLQRRREQRRNPAAVAEHALYYGMPVLETALTLSTDDAVYYRGHAAGVLALSASVEQVATLLWCGVLPADAGPLFASAPRTLSSRCARACSQLSGLSLLDKFAVLLPLAAGADRAAYDLRPASVAQTGARILWLLAVSAAGGSVEAGDLAGALQRSWARDDPRAELPLRAALILSADHGLSMASFAARCVASARATPYAVVQAGIAACQGVAHRGSIGRVEALFREVGTPERAGSVIEERLVTDEGVPGFDHPVYPHGDPRGRLLLDAVTTAYPETPAVQLAHSLVDEVGAVLKRRPTLDVGLVTLAGAMRLPPGGALALFVLGRTIGWIAQAIEQYQQSQPIRPVARYVGPQPVV